MPRPAEANKGSTVGVSAESPIPDYFFLVSRNRLRDTTLSPEARFLLMLIRSFANEETLETWVSLKELERIAGIGEHKRQRLQAELKDAGCLEYWQEKKYSTRAGRNVHGRMWFRLTPATARPNPERGESVGQSGTFEYQDHRKSNKHAGADRTTV